MRNTEQIHTYQCFMSTLAVLPDNDIHDQHVSNQPHHAHYGVESGDHDRYDNRIRVVLSGPGQSTVPVASRLHETRGVVAVGEVPTQAVVVKHRDRAPVIRHRAVACALHGPRPVVVCGGCCARGSSPAGVCLWTRCL